MTKTLIDVLKAHEAVRVATDAQARISALTGLPSGVLDDALQAANGAEQLARLAGGGAAIRGAIEARNQALTAVGAIAGTAGHDALLDQIRRTHAEISSMSAVPIAPLEFHDGTYDASTVAALYGAVDVQTAFGAEHFAGLDGYVDVGPDGMAILGGAAAQFETLQSAVEFARVGLATLAAAELFADPSARRLGADYDPFVDPFFGAFGRLRAFPDRYERDRGAQREVADEVGADNGLLDLEPAEASALFHGAVRDRSGTPVLLFGRSTALFLVGDANREAYALLGEVERRLRARVDRVMSTAHGRAWLSDRCPDLEIEWAARREKDRKAGLGVAPLIDYSELGELMGVIKDHWAAGFAVAGEKPRTITGPIAALIPFRNYTMHHRPVTALQYFGIVHNARKLECWLMYDPGRDKPNRP